MVHWQSYKGTLELSSGGSLTIADSMDRSKSKLIKRCAYFLIAIILILGVRRGLAWQDLVSMINKPKGLVVYVR